MVVIARIEPEVGTNFWLVKIGTVQVGIAENSKASVETSNILKDCNKFLLVFFGPQDCWV